MKRKNKNTKEEPPDSMEPGDDIPEKEFQFVLKQLLGAYKPILEQDLKRASSPEALTKEAENDPPDCNEEVEQANRIFEKFFTEKVALESLPVEARELLGPIDRWQWCWRKTRCCMIFGWLLCRGQRNFKSFSYYLYLYWRCVREVLGNPVAQPPTVEQKADFQVLVDALAKAYHPYLKDQLASVQFSSGIPEEIFSGQIDCDNSESAMSAVFERMFSAEVGPALFGAALYDQLSKEPFFWFCRCWCLCAIRFGCCLARARNLLDVFRCLQFYFRCLRYCFRPLRCELLEPTDCVDEEPNPEAGPGLSVTVIGTAAGAFFKEYTLEWRKVEGNPCDDDSGWSQDGVVYPGGTPTGSNQVNNGILGWVNTTLFAAGAYQIRVCVHSTQPSVSQRCCCIEFNLFKQLVWIDYVADQPVKTGTGFGPFNPSSPIVDSNPDGNVVPVGCCVRVRGSAYVGECNDRKIKCFDLRYGIGFLPGPDEVGFNPADYTGSLLASYGPVCYTPPDEAQKRAPWNQVIGRNLTTHFAETEIDFLGSTIKVWKLKDFCFNSANQLPPCPSPHHHCRSGKYTLLLDVEDTLGNHYYDTQHVWFDNKPIHVDFGGIEGLPRCSDLSLDKFVPDGAACSDPWPSNLLGIAYDEYIDYTDLSYPSDNFGYYLIRITRQGGPTYNVPITPSLIPPVFGPNPLHGTQRVGDPGTRCETMISGCPPPVTPAKFYGLLTQLDLRIFDQVCASSLVAPFKPPAGFALVRGECCGYTFQLYARDITRSNSPALCHEKWSLPWAVCICNDIGADDNDNP